MALDALPWSHESVSNQNEAEQDNDAFSNLLEIASSIAYGGGQWLQKLMAPSEVSGGVTTRVLSWRGHVKSFLQFNK